MEPIILPLPQSPDALEALLLELVVKTPPTEEGDWRPLRDIDHFDQLLYWCQTHFISASITALWGDRVEREGNDYRKIARLEHGGTGWENTKGQNVHWQSEGVATTVPYALVYALLSGHGVSFLE